ncbi:MAG: ornithine carbamoyltransferase [Clostridia bacterium]|nr:ornithine carbamoyltransferase [Clostridia bacterium]
MKHLLSIHDLTVEEVEKILTVAQDLKKKQKQGIPHPILKNKTLGMIFSKSSTRTRVSFEVGMYQLGGHALFLSSNDIQLGRGETIYDTANVLSRYLDGIMIRTYAQSDVEDLAKYGSIPIINGLTDLLHPCQALTDMLTISEHKGKLAGLKLAYLGDGNNMAHSLLYAGAKLGMQVSVATPEGFECNAEIVANAKEDAKKTGAVIDVSHDPVRAATGADAIYTDTWISMGQTGSKESRLATFHPYQVNSKMMGYAKEDSIFLHCLPAYRGYEVTEDVIDGPQSVVFDEAENRLHTQKAVMALLMAD